MAIGPGFSLYCDPPLCSSSFCFHSRASPRLLTFCSFLLISNSGRLLSSLFYKHFCDWFILGANISVRIRLDCVWQKTKNNRRGMQDRGLFLSATQTQSRGRCSRAGVAATDQGPSPFCHFVPPNLWLLFHGPSWLLKHKHLRRKRQKSISSY